MSCACTGTFEEDLSAVTIIQGDTAYWHIAFTDPCGAAIDVSNWEIYLMLRDSMEPDDLTVCRTIQVTAPENEISKCGNVVLSATSVETADIPSGKYFYEFKRVIREMTPPDVYTFARSDKRTFEVKPGMIIT